VGEDGTARRSEDRMVLDFSRQFVGRTDRERADADADVLRCADADRHTHI